MSYIDKTETTLSKRLYYNIKTIIKEGKEINIYNIKPFIKELSARYTDQISEFNRNNKRALGALKSVISNDNNDCFKDKTSFKDLYDSIVKTFSQTSLELIGRYFDKIVDTNYGSFSNMDEYINNIQLFIIYLTKLNQTISKLIVAWLILKGLLNQYNNYVSRKYEELIKDLNEIDVFKLINDLILKEGRFNFNINLKANKTSFNNN